MIRYHGEPYEGSDDQANDMLRGAARQEQEQLLKIAKVIRDTYKLRHPKGACSHDLSHELAKAALKAMRAT